MQIAHFQEESGVSLPASISLPGVGQVSLTRLVSFTGRRFLRLAERRDESSMFPEDELEAAECLLSIIKGKAPTQLSVAAIAQLLSVCQYCMADRLLASFPLFLKPLFTTLASLEADAEVRSLVWPLQLSTRLFFTQCSLRRIFRNNDRFAHPLQVASVASLMLQMAAASTIDEPTKLALVRPFGDVLAKSSVDNAPLFVRMLAETASAARRARSALTEAMDEASSPMAQPDGNSMPADNEGAATALWQVCTKLAAEEGASPTAALVFAVLAVSASPQDAGNQSSLLTAFEKGKAKGLQHETARKAVCRALVAACSGFEPPCPWLHELISDLAQDSLAVRNPPPKLWEDLETLREKQCTGEGWRVFVGAAMLRARGDRVGIEDTISMPVMCGHGNVRLLLDLISNEQHHWGKQRATWSLEKSKKRKFRAVDGDSHLLVMPMLHDWWDKVCRALQCSPHHWGCHLGLTTTTSERNTAASFALKSDMVLHVFVLGTDAL